jgi:hypothetical protein
MTKEHRHQQAKFGIRQTECFFNPGEQRCQNHMKKMRNSVGDADQTYHHRILFYLSRRHWRAGTISAVDIKTPEFEENSVSLRNFYQADLR